MCVTPETGRWLCRYVNGGQGLGPAAFQHAADACLLAEEEGRRTMFRGRAFHLCVDMQNMFAEETPWHTPWMARVLPRVVRLSERHPERTIFTRFIPAAGPGEGRGVWARYWEHWSSMTRKELPPKALALVDPLARLTPPADVLDKCFYSPWYRTDLERRLRAREVETLIVSGAETDVCVLAAVLGAIDRGFYVVLAEDAICSSTDETHDALMKVYRDRYSQQVETACVAEIMAAWA
jgi:nicotinamidase-related amidase